MIHETTDYIQLSLNSGKGWLQGLLADLQGNETTFPTSKGGNHPLWVAGHLAYAEGGVIGRFILGEQHPLARWESLFGRGSQPAADASKYPTLSEVLAEWDKLRARTLQVLSTLQDSDLDKPSKAPPERQAMFGTIGQCFAALANHQMFHTGQVADARRAAGLHPVFA